MYLINAGFVSGCTTDDLPDHLNRTYPTFEDQVSKKSPFPSHQDPYQSFPSEFDNISQPNEFYEKSYSRDSFTRHSFHNFSPSRVKSIINSHNNINNNNTDTVCKVKPQLNLKSTISSSSRQTDDDKKNGWKIEALKNGEKIETLKNGGKIEALKNGGKIGNLQVGASEKSVRFGSSQYISTSLNDDHDNNGEAIKPVLSNSNGDHQHASTNVKVKGILKTNFDANMMSFLLDSEDGTPV